MSIGELFLLLGIGLIVNSVPAIILEVFSLRLPLRVPIDCGASLRGNRILGDNKTVAGLILMVISAYCIVLIAEVFLSTISVSIGILDGTDIYIVAPCIGLGAFFGDTFGSFVKRRLGIAPGHDFIILDNIDWALGITLLFTLFFSMPSFIHVAGAVALFGCLHAISDRFARSYNLRR